MTDDRATDTGLDTQLPSISEPLEDLARLAFDHAEALCAPEDRCVNYHRFWSLLRVLDMDGRLPRGGPFLSQNFRDIAPQTGRLRVLLAGAADTGVPALILNTVLDAGLAPELTVIDRCRTPLSQIGRFSEMCGLQITTEHGPLWDCTETGFDAVVTHNVMLFNTDGDRKRIYAMAARVLRPGGRLLSIETLCDSFTPRPPEKTEEMTASFVARMRGKGLPENELARLGEAAKAFWSRQNRAEVYPEARLREHVAGAGLRLRRLDYQADDEPTSPRVLSSPKSRQLRAFVASERPA